MEYERSLFYGNIMATKNWIAQVFRIIQIIQILRAKSSKQNCLDQEIKERVGISYHTSKID